MKPMKVLIACEYSGRVCKAFTDKGHYAMSVDLLPTEQDVRHYCGDVFDVLYDGWDILIAHPPCTYLCNSGVRWLYNPDGSKNQIRWIDMINGAIFYKRLWNAPIKKKCIENPVMHGHAKKIIGPGHIQIIQPWQFGHGEIKATCLRLEELPDLKPTNIVDGRKPVCHRVPPSKNRAKLRSLTCQGFADAFADQWG